MQPNTEATTPRPRATKRTTKAKPTPTGRVVDRGVAAFEETPAARWLAEHFELTNYNGDVLPAGEVIGRLAEVRERLRCADAALDALAATPPFNPAPGEPGTDAAASDGWAPTEAADPKRARRVFGALGAFLETEAAAVLFSQAGEALPDRPMGRPRLGFTPTPQPRHREAARDAAGRVLDGYEAHRCALTGARFALPIGAPVPALLLDVEDAAGALDHEWALTVHPRLYAEGPGAVYRALWALVMRDLHAAFEGLQLAVEHAAAACHFGPGEIEGAPSTAYSWVPDGPAGEPRPARRFAGWVDLPRT
jgi:hypothetical protein